MGFDVGGTEPERLELVDRARIAELTRSISTTGRRPRWRSDIIGTGLVAVSIPW